jgi:predicted metal-binding protein
MLKERLKAIFEEVGFDEYREIQLEDIVFSQDVIDQCAQNKCGNYGKNHGCPPFAGTEEERKARVLKYKNFFLVNKIVSLASRKDIFTSYETVAKAIEDLRKAVEGFDVMVMGAGPCTVCKRCSALDGKPCYFPEKTQYSMEGSGIDVVRMSIDQKMTYNAGRGRIGYFSLVMYNE